MKQSLALYNAFQKKQEEERGFGIGTREEDDRDHDFEVQEKILSTRKVELKYENYEERKEIIQQNIQEYEDSVK